METVGQIYMAACGAPEKTENHAQNVAELALNMIKSVKTVEVPSKNRVEIRIGKICLI